MNDKKGKKKVYKTAASFRTALEHRLLQYSREHTIDIMRVLRQCAFDRFLVRIFSSDIGKTFGLRNTHSIPKELQKPPDFWKDRYTVLAEECGMNTDINTAFSEIANFWKIALLEQIGAKASKTYLT